MGEIDDKFICKIKLCPCRQMMRYVMGSVPLPHNGYWNSEKVILKANVLALQRDVLKERRSRIVLDPILLEERSEELKDIRKQLQMLDSRWGRCRVRKQVNVNQRPLITGDVWRKLIFTRTIENDWDLWNEKESSEQWDALERIGSVTQGPAPGAAEEGSDEDAYAV